MLSIAPCPEGAAHDDTRAAGFFFFFFFGPAGWLLARFVFVAFFLAASRALGGSAGGERGLMDLETSRWAVAGWL